MYLKNYLLIFIYIKDEDADDLRPLEGDEEEIIKLIPQKRKST